MTTYHLFARFIGKQLSASDLGVSCVKQYYCPPFALPMQRVDYRYDPVCHWRQRVLNIGGGT
jgi:hypothetical protein